MHRGGADQKREIVPEVDTSTGSLERGQQMGARILTRARQEVNVDAKERENEKLMGSE